MVPLLVSEVFQLGAAGTWASLGGFSAAVADRGGVYRVRALTMGWLTIGAAIGVALGGLVGGNGWIAVPITFLVVGALSFLRAYGVSAGGVGSSIAVAFAISLAAPAASPVASLWRGVYLVAGGAWAMFLALVLWPIRPFRPLRLATARCYVELADYANSVALEAEVSPDESDRAALQARRREIRLALEEARMVVAGEGRGTPAAASACWCSCRARTLFSERSSR